MNLKTVGKWLGIGIMAVVITAVVYIVSTDFGGMAGRDTGAGEIWWTSAPEVEKAYQDITSRSKD